MITTTIYTALFFGLAPITLTVSFLLASIQFERRITIHIILLIIYQIGCYSYLYFGATPKPVMLIILAVITPIFLMGGSIGLTLTMIKEKKSRLLGCTFITFGYLTVAMQIFLYITSLWGTI